MMYQRQETCNGHFVNYFTKEITRTHNEFFQFTTLLRVYKVAIRLRACYTPQTRFQRKKLEAFLNQGNERDRHHSHRATDENYPHCIVRRRHHRVGTGG